MFENACKQEFNGPLDEFYHEFDDFEYNPRNSPMAEFRRLMFHKRWKPKDDAYKSARNDFFDAFKKEFDGRFGADEKSIRTWQQLCEVLGVEPTPESLKECKKVSSMLNTS